MTTAAPTLELTRTADDYGDLAVECLRPAQGGELWDWCANNLATERGIRWEPRRARLMKHWYRVASARLNRRPDPRDPYAHLCEQLILSIAGQLAKSMFGRAVLCFSWACCPRTSAFYRARLSDLKNDRDNKFWQMVDKTEPLRRLLPNGAAALKSAMGAGSWTLGTALHYWRSGSIGDDLRSDAIELAVPDEFDTYPADVDGYGDPIDQILTRQRTFRKSRLLVATTTPGTVSGHGWRRTCTGTHERPLIDCPHCGAAQDLSRRGVALDGGRKFTDVHPTEILNQRLGRYVCQVNGCLIGANDLNTAIVRMLESDRPWCPGEWIQDDGTPNGRWKHHGDVDAGGRLIAIPPPQSIIRSGQACSLYSLDETLDTFAAREAIAQQGTAQNLKTHVNNEGAEPYISIVTDVNADDLVSAAQEGEPYVWGSLNRTAKFLLLVFDQQGNSEPEYWFPWIVRAFDQGGESWLVDAGKAMSAEERDQISAKFWDIGGVKRRADKVVMDRANGNAHIQMMLWCAREPSRRILLRGDPKLREGLPWLLVEHKPGERRRTPIPAGVKHYRMAPHLWRDRLWDRVINRQPAAPKNADTEPAPSTPRTWWLPENCPDWYANSLTSEEQVVIKNRVIWTPRTTTGTDDRTTVRSDNHWWDCEAMAQCAADIFGWLKAPPPAVDPEKPKPAPLPQSGFMTGYGGGD